MPYSITFLKLTAKDAKADNLKEKKKRKKRKDGLYYGASYFCKKRFLKVL